MVEVSFVSILFGIGCILLGTFFLSKKKTNSNSNKTFRVKEKVNFVRNKRDSTGTKEKCEIILAGLQDQAQSDAVREQINFLYQVILGTDDLQNHLMKDSSLENSTREWISQEFSTSSRGGIGREVSLTRGRSESQLKQIPQAILQKPEIQDILKKIDSFNDFDIFELNKVSDGNALKVVGWYVLHRWGCVKEFKIDPVVLERWLSEVEELYQDNPYHNQLHAADVLQCIHCLLLLGMQKYFDDDVEVFSLLVSAIIHDIGHDGKTNAYHNNIISERSLQYNEQSVQENYHASQAMKLLQNEETNICENMTKTQFREFRAIVIRCVLGTDMQNHFAHVKEMKLEAEARENQAEKWPIGDRALLRSMTLHLADLSNPLRPIDKATKWANALLEETFLQGDEEKKLGLPISPLCDRNTTELPNSQIGFLNYVVLPFLEVFAQILPELQNQILPQTKQNLQIWEQRKGQTNTPIKSTNISPQKSNETQQEQTEKKEKKEHEEESASPNKYTTPTKRSTVTPN